MTRPLLLAVLLSTGALAQGAEDGTSEEELLLPPGVELVESGSPPGEPAEQGFPRLKFGGYVDVGAFKAQNRGVGFIFDTQDRFSERYPGVAWVLLGDPLSTTVNSRGEAADLSGSFAFTDDPIASRGAFTFIVNEVNLELLATLSENLFAFASVDVLPRSGWRGSLGDRFEMDYAYLEYQPFKAWDITLSAGKLDPAFGREYRIQESVDRPGVTPSLLFRYVGGHPIGVKGRGVFFGGHLTAALLVANGSSFIESMQQGGELANTDFKTVSGRVSGKLGPSFATLELGVSGEAGPQSRQTDPSVGHWQYGLDAVLETRPLELRGEFVRGIAAGGGLDDADGLDYRAFFVEAHWRALNWLSVIARYEERHATQWKSDEFVYVMEVQRVVGGVRFMLHPRVFLKAEYLANFELEPLPSFANDVVTSSLVVHF